MSRLSQFDKQRLPRGDRPIYTALLPKLRDAARLHGYALGLHGSMRRDLDLIAVPWTTHAVSVTELVEVLAIVVKAVHGASRVTEADERPHGRKCYVIVLPIAHHYIDLSVMPL